MSNLLIRFLRTTVLSAAVSTTFALSGAGPDLKFDVATFCCPCSGDDHLCQTQFDHLNFPSTNGHYIAMGSDAHRLDLATNGNALAVYFNTLNDGWTTNSGAVQAALIDQYVTNGFTSTGARPDWVILNELSAGLWPGDASYRSWVHDVVHALNNTYHYSVVLYSPFPNPANNSADWQAVVTDAYVAVENYLSGSDVAANGFSVSWCQSQYQSSVASYASVGVAKSRLMLGEHFAQTTNGVSYGRAGIASNDWDTVIAVRNQAAKNVGFAGFLSYAWSGNSMLVSDDELVRHEDIYRTNSLPNQSALSASFVLIQPQDQTVPVGGSVSFIVFAAGNAARTYQWRHSGTNLPGATAVVLTLTNLQLGDAGTYSVLISNAAGATFSSNAVLSVQVPPPLAFDPFAPALTTYAVGTPLIRQTNSAGQGWTQAGPTNANQAVIASNSLSVSGLAASSGNSIRFGSDGTSARFNIGSTINTGTIYYSFAFALTDISTLNSSGIFWAGFNNSAGSQTTTPTFVATRVVTKSATGGYSLGLDKSSGSTGSFAFVTNIFQTNQVVLVVGSYQFNPTTTNDDVAQLWVNPDPATFGAAAAPPASLTNTAGNDLSQVASFVFFDRNAAEPAGILADELRVGTSWASVTPPATSQSAPQLNVSRSGSNVILSWTNTAASFTLETAQALASLTQWTNATGTVVSSGGQFFVTNSAAAGNSYYRLRK